ncbi:MAG TPA: VOC family protein [Actinomycetota bacterium]|nr:VOC family protein [Actinomycetota bacterium]
MSGWRVTGLHHVAVASDEDRAGEDLFVSLLGAPVHEEDGEGFVERMYDAGGPYLQTLEATGDGVVQRFLDRRGPGLHHIAFRVDRIDAALEDLEARGVPLIDRTARPGGMGTRIAFLHPAGAGGVLVELVEGASEEVPRGGANDA